MNDVVQQVVAVTEVATGTPFVTVFTIFVLAIFVGYYVVWSVTPALHTPLMAVTNAVSGIIVVGAMLQSVTIQDQSITPTSILGALAVFFASINIFGGFAVTGRMLEMFKGKKKKEANMDNLAQYADWAYLVGAILFILTLRGLSSPASAIRGNLYGKIGMTLAILATVFVAPHPNLGVIAIAMIAGAIIGIWRAKTVPMTQMPETVAMMHSLVGLAAVLISIATVLHAGMHHDAVHRVELFIGCFVGAVTFTASIIAWGKLSAKLGAKPLKGAWVKPVQAVLFLAMLGFGIDYFVSENLCSFFAMTGIALVFGYFWIAPIGGGDMPVVVSLLNSLSGWAAAGIGFTLNNSMLIVAGSLVGSSGAILSYIMCKAMNRSLLNVLFGGFGATAAGPAAAGDGVEKTHRSGSPEDASFMMSNADSVVIVPGYGLAQARAQNAVKELADALKAQGVKVSYAIHPVAGRMPGHMNVLLAEADVPYEDVKEMDEINNDFASTDVVLIIGANDVVNPAAKNDASSPIYGMPILEAQRARAIMVIKRSMSPGYAGLDNDIFYMDKTMMIFGDAKKVVEDMIKSLNGGGH